MLCIPLSQILLCSNDNCSMSSEGAKNISKSLCKNVTMLKLNMADNNIEDEGVMAVSECIEPTAYYWNLI